MTCIVGIIDKENKNVVIGGDSAASTNTIVLARKDPKVYHNGPFLIGTTTSFRMAQILRFCHIPPMNTEKGLFEYMCTSFIDAVREAFTNGGYMGKDDDGTDLGGAFLVGYMDKLFIVESDFQVGEPGDYFAAVGCGDKFAYGALHAMSRMEGIDVRTQVCVALEAAAQYSPFCQAPFTISETQTSVQHGDVE